MIVKKFYRAKIQPLHVIYGRSSAITASFGVLPTEKICAVCEFLILSTFLSKLIQIVPIIIIILLLQRQVLIDKLLFFFSPVKHIQGEPFQGKWKYRHESTIKAKLKKITIIIQCNQYSNTIHTNIHWRNVSENAFLFKSSIINMQINFMKMFKCYYYSHIRTIRKHRHFRRYSHV